MSDDELVTLATYPDEGTAAIAQSTLTAAGIPAYAADGATTTTLWHVDTALGGVRLQVPSSHSEDAIRVLREARTLDNKAAPAQDWSCSRCKADIDAGFGFCWSCGAAAPESLVSPSPDAVVETPIVDRDVETPAELSYAHDASPSNDPSTSEDEEALEDRAWRATLISIVLPLILPYTAILTMRLAAHDLSPRGNRRSFASLLILFAPFCTWWVLLNPLS